MLSHPTAACHMQTGRMKKKNLYCSTVVRLHVYFQLMIEELEKDLVIVR